jgi:hypothetical protein
LLAEVKAAKDAAPEVVVEEDAPEATIEDAAVTPELYPVVEDVEAEPVEPAEPTTAEGVVDADRT